VDLRRTRLAVNEGIFRTVNERIQEVNDSFATVTDAFEIVCECSDASCVTQISVTKAAYEHVRADPELFIVASGHEKPEVESMVQKKAAYDVVRKRPGLPEKVAKGTDPRR
jgi:hypothetical protein